jgi:hypothetical protein
MPNERPQLYGDGTAAASIAEALYTLKDVASRKD